MAALNPAQMELANSLTQDELPTKLRCAVCSKLAVNAFRLPCCETAICEDCQSSLPSSCPVCEHSPVSGADCTIYKSLRTTIRVFLKTQEKKREAARPKASTPTTPLEPTPTPNQPEGPTEPVPVDAAPSTGSALAETRLEHRPAVSGQEETEDAPVAPDQASALPVSQENELAVQPGDQSVQGQEGAPHEHAEADDKSLEATDENAEDVQEHNDNDDSAMDAGQDAMGDNYSGMNYGDMNQMQMMMAMQNGMNPAAFASFPMMGMSMGMDPMAMQNVFMNGGFGAQGMGMNGMNMNMGMNGFSGGNNDWSGQQSWNVGQDNFNPSAAGMGNGDFGNFNSGFRNGYNPGNYGHNQYNDFGRGSYGFRGRGRGRGFYRGFGRGYHQGNNPRHFGQEMWAQQMAQNAAGGDMQHDSNGTTTLGQGQDTHTDEFGRTVRPDAQPRGEGEELTGDDETRTGGPDGEEKHMVSGDSHEDYATAQNGDVSVDSSARARGPGMGYGPPSSAAADVPLNAPTGPKAMRQGLPNTSALHLRARGFMTDQSNPLSASNGSSVQSPLEDVQASRSSSQHPKETTDLHQSDRARDRDHEPEKARRRDINQVTDGVGPGPRSRSRSQDRKESRRYRRHRSESVSNDEHADDSRRRRHKSRRSTRDDVDKSRAKDDKTERSRSASPERERTRDRDRDHKRSSHRSHRDRDREKEKENDYDRHDRHRKSGHRSRHGHDRDRSRDRNRERERDRKERPRDRDRDRERDRDRDRDREHRHRSRRTSADPPTPAEAASADFNPPTGPRSGLSIRGTGPKGSGLEAKGESGNNKSLSSQKREVESSRRGSQASIGAPKGASSSKDVLTLEREARDRERLLKEAQRMAGLASLAGLKRNRDGGDDRSGRRKSRRSEAVYDDEERLRRLEAEREGGRWD